jgi:hypothetical protein
MRDIRVGSEIYFNQLEENFNVLHTYILDIELAQPVARIVRVD